VERFKKDFSYLDIAERIGYYAVFGGYGDLSALHRYENLRENIIHNILERYETLKNDFIYTQDTLLQKDLDTLLFRIAVGDRKSHSIYKNDISQPRGRELYKLLFDQEIINKEYSRETPLPKIPGRFLKKELRRYRIEDKIRFNDNFTRFWFTFILPFEEEIAKGEFGNVLCFLDRELDKFISFTFETLSNILIRRDFKSETITETGSYWDKDIELDLLAKTASGKIIAGECKWKNQRISKNILNKLQKKWEHANLNVGYYALFSKSGFSNELLKSKERNLLLYDLQAFDTLL
jgi:hypothetical protein